MRFIPTTFMQSGDCVKAYSNGSASGSFTSGSDVFQYHEWKLSDRNVSETYQLVVTQGFTSRARAVLIAGGGGGGWNGQGSYGLGGGGGAGQVIDTHNLQLYPTTYSLRIGHGGLPADADNTNPALRTYNGGDGDYTEINGGSYTGGSVLRAIGGDGGYGDQSQTGTYLHGGDSGNGFTGGANDGNYAGGGAGASQIGEDGQDTPSTDRGGNGGNGVTITLPFTSNIWGSTSKAVAGGGGGSADFSNTQGFGTHGGGNGSRKDAQAGTDAERYTGAGGGGGANFAYTPPNGEGTQGGDGVLIIYYPITNCIYHDVTSASFDYSDSIGTVCTSTNSEILYYKPSEGLNTGSRLYQDILLQYPASSSYYELNNTNYFVSGTTGLITSIAECAKEYTVYFNSDSSSACINTTPTNIYTTSSVLELGTMVYYDYGLTNPVTQSYFADGNQTTSNWYYVATSNGIITDSDLCNLYVTGSVINTLVSNTGSFYNTRFATSSLGTLQDTGVTLEVWAKNPALTQNYDAFIGLWDGQSSPDRDWIEVREINTNDVLGEIYDEGTATNRTSPSSAVADRNNWYHHVLTFDTGSGVLKYYRNGIVEGSGSGELEPGANYNTVYVGQQEDNQLCNMYIGEYRIYTSSLDASAIAFNFDGTKFRYGY